MKTALSKVKIAANTPAGNGYYKIVLDTRGIASGALPGQFVEVKIEGKGQPFLRRPFSVHRTYGNRLEILYAVVGCGTKTLAQKKPGEYLDIIGPLGNGFVCARRTTHDARPILVAGGMGVAPLMFLAERLFGVEGRRKIIVLLGARSKEQLVCEKEFKHLGCEVRVATDDGSKGFKGRVTQLLESILVKRRHLSTLYACGPRPMLREISRISQKYAIPAQISLEEHMSCGFGACMGCVVETREGYKRVCRDGPVFDAGQIIWR